MCVLYIYILNIHICMYIFLYSYCVSVCAHTGDDAFDACFPAGRSAHC